MRSIVTSCALLWLLAGLPGLLVVPASLANFVASCRFSFCRSVCSLRLPLPPPRAGPHHLPSLNESFAMEGKWRQRSGTTPPDVVSGKCSQGRCFRTGLWVLPFRCRMQTWTSMVLDGGDGAAGVVVVVVVVVVGGGGGWWVVSGGRWVVVVVGGGGRATPRWLSCHAELGDATQ